MATGAPSPVARRLDDAADAVAAPALPRTALVELVHIARELQAEEVDLDRLLPLVVSKAASMVKTDLAWIGLFDETSGTLRIRATHGNEHPEFAQMHVALGLGLGGVALHEHTTLVITDYPAYLHETSTFIRDAMAAERVVSVICAPMLRGTTMVGALYVANRRATRFTDEQAAMVSAMAAQASVAVQNGRLYRNLLDETALLEATFDIHRQLGAAAAADLGIEGVTSTLAELVGRPLVVEQDVADPAVVGAGVGEHADDEAEVTAVEVPIVLGGHAVGRIRVPGPAPLTPLAENALAHGATVLALELMRHRAAHEAEWRLRDELLQELLDLPRAPSTSETVRARRFGVDLDEPHRILVLEPGAGQTVAALGRRVQRAAARRRGVITTRRGEQLIVMVGSGEGEAAALVRALGEPAAFFVGVSSARRAPAQALREASACVALARSGGRLGSAVHHEDLGGLRFMLDVEHPARAAEVVRERLGVLASYERSGGAQLLDTLRAFLDADGHHPTVAARCHVHPSTVKYRLRRISQLLEARLDDAAVKFELQLAFRLLDLFRSVGRDLLTDTDGADRPAAS